MSTDPNTAHVAAVVPDAASGQILAALERLNARIDALEAKVDAASSPLARRAQEPDVAAAVDRLIDRLDKVEAAVEMVGHLAERVPTLADAAGTTAGWAYDQAVAAGVDPIAAGQTAAALALRAGQPETLALAERMLDQSDTLALVLDAADKVKREDLEVVLEQGAALTGQLAALLKTPELARLLDAGPKAVGVAETASTALVETRATKVEAMGPIAAFFAMRDPDVQRAVGFSLAVAKRFGQKLG